MSFVEVVETVADCIDGAGVAVIALGAVVVAVRTLLRAYRREARVYPSMRVELGRTILLGLELLVAGDIIRTVAVTPTVESVGVLAMIVAVRTFLSWSLELEISGRWPWQQKPDPGAPDDGEKSASRRP
ncbi:DUF1622 domain-containing protein [Rhodococcus sp. HNM0569]|uniref:DUF1622 domain-containing protein n=1 Tax=Rhodococcus sp. HNM0569 TaxID=2716340 RepID=UPI00146D7198|nr:DUF1622 domain-containing protein [Rhodococcus sp. HNM0569]NLU84305.1 DUF1622 domain-containing protein [Rhodococcus sp. HNM0569]